MATRNFRLSFQFLLGLIVITLGVFYTLDNLGVLYAPDYLRFWPTFIILYGISRVVYSETRHQKMWGVFWIVLGSLWVLDRMNIVYFSVWDLWPLLLIVLGLSLIWRPSRTRRSVLGVTISGDGSSTINAFAMMGGFKRSNDSQDFRGGEATAIMGGCEIDLRRASIKEGEAVLNLVAIMGGIEIWVPEDWKVILQGVPVLGGFEDKTHTSVPESSKRLIIRGYSIMGGVEIKN